MENAEGGEAVSSEDVGDIASLKKRIAALEEDASPGLSGGREMHLVFSLGFVVVSTLAMGAYGGQWLAKRFAWPGLENGVLAVSLCLAMFSAYRLLKPFMGK